MEETGNHRAVRVVGEAFRQGSEDRLDEGIVFSASISTTSDCRNPPSRLAVLGNKLGVLHAP